MSKIKFSEDDFRKMVAHMIIGRSTNLSYREDGPDKEGGKKIHELLQSARIIVFWDDYDIRFESN